MSYGALDDKLHSHPKTTKAGNAGVGVFCRALSYCSDHLTDGFVPYHWAREIAPPSLLKKVTEAGFWVEAVPGQSWNYVSDDGTYTVTIEERGFFIPDFLTHNPTRESVLAKRSELSKKRSEAGRKGAMVKWQRNGKPDGNGDGKRVANEVATSLQTDGPLTPTPSPESSTNPSTSVEDPKPDAGGDRETTIEMVKGHALRLVAALREGPRHRPARVKEDIVEFARWLTAADFEKVREELLYHRRDIKNDGKWTLARLENLADVVKAQEVA